MYLCAFYIFPVVQECLVLSLIHIYWPTLIYTMYRYVYKWFSFNSDVTLYESTKQRIIQFMCVYVISFNSDVTLHESTKQRIYNLYVYTWFSFNSDVTVYESTKQRILQFICVYVIFLLFRHYIIGKYQTTNYTIYMCIRDFL